MPGYSPIFPETTTFPAFTSGKMPRLNSIRRVVNREGFRVTKALIDALTGAAVGGAALATHKIVGNQTPGDMGSNGGLRTITTITDVNRVTTAADVTAVEEFLVNVSVRPSPYVRDLSGNGGPALA